MTANKTMDKTTNIIELNNEMPSVWLAEGQSSQRDMLASLQQLKVDTDGPLQIIASHRSNRPEIFEFADKVFIEPNENGRQENDKLEHDAYERNEQQPRWQFVLDNAIKTNTKVLLTGRNSVDYEAERAQFEQAGIRLLTGATSVDMLDKIDDKFAFIQHCKAHNIPVAEGWRFDSLNELMALLDTYGDKALCVKPVTGIFAQGFWRLDTDKSDSNDNSNQPYDSFEHLYFTDNRKIHSEQFISAYANSLMIKDRPIPMLLMPYLAGQEYSVDVVCERGEVLGAITRHKVGKVQHIGYDKKVMAIVLPLIRAFGCDGIVSVQTKADSDGNHKVLEINSRPSGGIGYTKHSGVDLTQLGFAYWLGLTDKQDLETIAKQIQPCQVRSIMSSVMI